MYTHGGVYLVDVHLTYTGVRLAHKRIPYGHASRRRASHERIPYSLALAEFAFPGQSHLKFRG
jgi:hypothetical protein